MMTPPWIAKQLAEQRQRELVAGAERHRRAREGRRADHDGLSFGPKSVATLLRSWLRLQRQRTSDEASSKSLWREGAKDSPSVLESNPHSADLAERLSALVDQWSSEVIARVNDHEIRVFKGSGNFVWESHENTDEVYLVIRGRLTIQMPHAHISLGPGQLFVVPRGIEHCPIADNEAQVMLIEAVGV
jgi:mannose-6-phosphate isomerase-like protein (cupin superfamily)